MYRQNGPARRKYLSDHGCAKCGRLAGDVHEIFAGCYRSAAFAEPAAWLALCRECHDLIQGIEWTQQLALKLIADPHNFDRSKCDAIVAPRLIDWPAVLDWAAQYLAENAA